MANLYITSSETFSGKSALCIGLGVHLKKDGHKPGFMKPVNINCPIRDGLAFDEDVIFAKEILELPETTELLSPVALTPAKLEQQLRGPETNYEPVLIEAYKKVSEGRDLLILEGGRSLREGYLAGLPPKKVVELLDALVLVVLKFDESLMVDRAINAQDYFGQKLIGIVINKVPRSRMSFVLDAVVQYLNRHKIHMFGALPNTQLLAAPSVREMADGLKAEILAAPDRVDELVEHMLVGAMSAEKALSYFRRQPNKAVITGGDRADIQMAALETPTTCLILTGNLYPNPVVLNRAEELNVPVLLTNLDTLSTIEVVEGYFGRSRFQQAQKREILSSLLDEHFDFITLYNRLGIK
jgi:BioD-like phosphotransacetylase family protein